MYSGFSQQQCHCQYQFSVFPPWLHNQIARQKQLEEKGFILAHLMMEKHEVRCDVTTHIV